MARVTVIKSQFPTDPRRGDPGVRLSAARRGGAAGMRGGRTSCTPSPAGGSASCAPSSAGGPPVGRAPGAGRRRRAFTLAELLVSVAIMSLLLITVGAIFAMSTKATSLANANNEVMNNLRALEQQLRQDFRGIRRDAFLGLCYNYLRPRQVDPNRPESAAVRSDWIVFFANGDFQTLVQRWDPTSKPPSATGPNAAPICGNLARIEYGMLGMFDYSTTDTTNWKRPLATVQLGRFAKLMIPDLYPGSLPAQTADNPPLFSAFITNGFTGASVYENWEYEYTTQFVPPSTTIHATLADWRNPFVWPATTTAGYPNDQSYATWLVGCYRPGTTPRRNNLWLGLGYIDLDRTGADHLRMIPGCISFRIQRWAEQDPVNPANNTWIPRWWPETIVAYDSAGAPVYENNDNDSNPVGTAPLNPLPAGPFTPDHRIWECYNVPPNIPNPGQAAAAQDWPQAMTDNQAWPWITRDFNRNAADWSDGRRAVKADFPKALKITVTVLDTNRRMLEKVPAKSDTLDDTRLNELGAQSFSMIIPLE